MITIIGKEWVNTMEKIFKESEQLDLFGNSEQENIELSLFDRFIIPPFSIFDCKQGYWQKRKKLGCH